MRSNKELSRDFRPAIMALLTELMLLYRGGSLLAAATIGTQPCVSVLNCTVFFLSGLRLEPLESGRK